MESYLVVGDWPEVGPRRLASAITRLPLTSDLELSEQLTPTLTSQASVDFRSRTGWRGVGVIGLADDHGVALNGGRVGARDGPDAFRHAVARYGSNRADAFDAMPPIIDLGNIEPGEELEETHDRVTKVTQEAVRHGLLVVGIGGGHDLTLALVRGVSSELGVSLFGCYFDAHLDVRPERGSGMPFRRLIEMGAARALNCIGYDPFANTREHTDWFLRHGGELREFSPEQWPQVEDQFVSVDLDSLDSSQAPGVSAPNPNGLSARLLANYVEAAGRQAQVHCIDFMELAPNFDVDGRTARLTAHLFWRFIRGVTQRDSHEQQEAGGS